MPRISIILTSYNHEKYIRESIDSVLNQTFTEFELIILDDASSDNSWDIINSYSDTRIKPFRNVKNMLGTYLFNKAIAEIAKGEYIAVHHSDDIWEPDKLERQVKLLDSNPNVGAVFTNALAIGEDSLPLDDAEHFYSEIFNQSNRTRFEWLNHFFYKGNALCHPSILIRKRCYDDCGLYRYGLAQLTDFDMWIRLCLKYEIYVLPEKLVRFRVRANEANASGGRPESRIRTTTEFYFVLKNYLQLNSFKDLVKVFPEEQGCYRADGCEPKFILAMAALKNKSNYLKLFGIELLFDLISDEKTAANLKALYDFNHLAFIKITGVTDVFSTESLMEQDKQIAHIYNSRSWRLTSSLRFLNRKFGSCKTYSLKKTRLAIEKYARVMWACMPLSALRKSKIKNKIFKWVPFFSSYSSFYRSWENASVAQNMQFYASDNVTYVPLIENDFLINKTSKLISFYLPQFHPIAENNEWWGEGFTEWTNVKPAQPQFEGHYQPHIPGELGYYSLLDPATQQRQVELAKLYGLGGFCFYFYWFGGKRLLESPVLNYLSDKNLDLPFCLCWANENWSRRWDGLDGEILISQQHSPEDNLAFIEYVSQYMLDSRYISIDGKPLLLVYRPNLLPSAKVTAQCWRDWCIKNGIGEIYLAYTQSFEMVDPAEYGFDAAIEFPPNNSSPPNITDNVVPLSQDFDCNVYDWRVFTERSESYKVPSYQLFRGVCPSWDNTARRKNHSNVFLNSSPSSYQRWLKNAITYTVQQQQNADERLIFINAWNEWAEGTHLEPDQKYGYAYLEATRMALVRSNSGLKSMQYLSTQSTIAVVIHVYYCDVFAEILNYLAVIYSFELKLYVTTTPDNEELVMSQLTAQKHDFLLKVVENRGRDILPFLRVMPTVIKAGHSFLVKVHTKKSLHRSDGAVWREDLYEKNLTEYALSQAIKNMINNPSVGIVGPDGHLVEMGSFGGGNMSTVIDLALRMGVTSNELFGLSFVAGSMFVARPEAMSPLLNLAINPNHFEQEQGQVDGTLAHAIERLFSVSAYSMSLETICPSSRTLTEYKYVKY